MFNTIIYFLLLQLTYCEGHQLLKGSLSVRQHVLESHFLHQRLQLTKAEFYGIIVRRVDWCPQRLSVHKSKFFLYLYSLMNLEVIHVQVTSFASNLRSEAPQPFYKFPAVHRASK